MSTRVLAFLIVFAVALIVCGAIAWAFSVPVDGVIAVCALAMIIATRVEIFT